MPIDINRHRIKSSYQRNMVIGQIVVALLFVVPVWILSSISILPESPSRETVKNIRNLDESGQMQSTVAPTRRNVGGRARTNADFRGQFGINYRIIPDIPTVPVPIASPLIYSIDVISALTDEDLSISDIDTGSYGAYIPDDANYTFDPWIEAESIDTGLTPITRGPELIHRVKPDIPPSAKMMGIGGEVDILILIDPEGKPTNFSVHSADSNHTIPEFLLEVVLKDGSSAPLEFYIDQHENDLLYVTLKDDPAEFKFAEYLHKVLPLWQFSPAIREGVPVYSFVHIHYCFCAPDDEDCVEFTITS